MGTAARIVFMILAVAVAVVLVVRHRRQAAEAAADASYDTVPPENVDRLREQGAEIVDIRPPRLFSRDDSRVADSVNVPAAELKTRLDEVPRKRPCLIVGDSRERMAWAAKLVSSAGVSNVFVLDGGIQAYHKYAAEQDQE